MRTTASFVTHTVGTSRTEALVATGHQRDSRVSRRQQTHLAIVGVCLRWHVWCGADLTFGLAVGVGHGSVVVVAVVSAQPAAVSTGASVYLVATCNNCQDSCVTSE